MSADSRALPGRHLSTSNVASCGSTTSDLALPPDASRASSINERRRGGPGGTRADRVPPAISCEAVEPVLLRPAEVALQLGISRSKVFELLASRELPSIHIGRSTRVPRVQLEEWIQAQVRWQPHANSGLLGRLQSATEPERR